MKQFALKQYAIVVVAYNRDKSLDRLLKSLAKAYYPPEMAVPLIISIDKSDNDAVEKTANEFVWAHGEKIVRVCEENMGLRAHVLSCGEYSANYDGIIVLEDDLYVAESFYMYAVSALDFVTNHDRIGGVSLYNHLLNVHVREPFLAIEDGYDNYYFQFASSWGQAYTKEQWAKFRKWYDENYNSEFGCDYLPKNVASWSDKSWLKYFIKYLCVSNKYFLYPRVSQTTNFADEGTHAKYSVCDLQVPLAGIRRYKQVDYIFSTVEESLAVYDAFFENECLKDCIVVEDGKEVTIDLYGSKPKALYKDYVLSSRALPYGVKAGYARKLRPVDANIFDEINGTDFWLYDTSIAGDLPRIDKAGKQLYNYRAIKVREMKEILFKRVRDKATFGKD